MSRWQNNLTQIAADFGSPEVRDRLPITALVIFQFAVFWVSTYWTEISFLCTVPKAGGWEVLGLAHALFLPLLIVGFVSAYRRSWRPFYITFLSLGVALLGLQVWLLKNGFLYCDSL